MTTNSTEKQREYSRRGGENNPEKVKIKNHKYKETANKIRDGYRDEWFQILKDHLGGKLECANCGYDEYFAAMDLHHRDPKTKIFANTFSRNYRYAPNPKRVLLVMAEVDKCELLCRNCHSVHHYLNGRDN